MQDSHIGSPAHLVLLGIDCLSALRNVDKDPTTLGHVRKTLLLRGT